MSSSKEVPAAPAAAAKAKLFKGSSDPAYYIDVGIVGIVLLVFGPLICSYVFPGWAGSIMYIIAAGCYLSMKMADRENKQRRLANIILGDHSMLKEVVDRKMMEHVLTYLPGYLRDCDMEQVRWANMAGAAVFPYAAAFEAHKMKIKLNDRLAQMKGLAEVTVQTLDAGSIAPFSTGVKVQPYRHDKRVVIDADIVWNGKPHVLINVRFGGQGFDIEVYEMTLNGKMRFIVGPLCVAATPAKALGISFRETPFIRFGMRIGGVDVMNLGSGPAQVRPTLLSIYLHQRIQKHYLYIIRHNMHLIFLVTCTCACACVCVNCWPMLGVLHGGQNDEEGGARRVSLPECVVERPR